MIETGDLRKGQTLEIDGTLFQVLDFQHLKLGRGSAQVRLKLRGVADRDAAEALRGSLLLIDVADLPALPAGQHYRFELIGCVAFSAAGVRFGVVSEVWDTGAAHDVLVIAGDDGKQRLLPMVAALMREKDIAGQRIVFEDVAGLIDPP